MSSAGLSPYVVLYVISCLSEETSSSSALTTSVQSSCVSLRLRHCQQAGPAIHGLLEKLTVKNTANSDIFSVNLACRVC